MSGSTTVCTCAVCGKQAPFRHSLPVSNGNNAHQLDADNMLPWGWSREFYAADPDRADKNRILCDTCDPKLRTQRGTVRFKAPADAKLQ